MNSLTTFSTVATVKSPLVTKVTGHENFLGDFVDNLLNLIMIYIVFWNKRKCEKNFVVKFYVCKFLVHTIFDVQFLKFKKYERIKETLF